jgi:HSP20 family protein
MASPSIQPLHERFETEKPLNQFFAQAFGSDLKGNEGQPQIWAPAVDICEDDQKILIKADLPGIDPNSVEIRVQGDSLTVHGERKLEDPVEGFSYQRVERAYGPFSRSFRLPSNFDSDSLTADYDDGVLSITIEKRKLSGAKGIKINVNIS